jgi:hypothetical protein
MDDMDGDEVFLDHKPETFEMLLDALRVARTNIAEALGIVVQKQKKFGIVFEEILKYFGSAAAAVVQCSAAQRPTVCSAAQRSAYSFCAEVHAPNPPRVQRLIYTYNGVPPEWQSAFSKRCDGATVLVRSRYREEQSTTGGYWSSPHGCRGQNVAQTFTCSDRD